MSKPSVPLFASIVPILCFLVLAPSPVRGATDSCLACHGDAPRMQKLGYPHFTVTTTAVARQSGMKAACSDCHLGNPAASQRKDAHRGMGRLLIVKRKGLVATPADRKEPLKLTGSPMYRIRYRTERGGKAAFDPTVATVLYQDKRRDTLSQNYPMMEKTCGGCHPREYAGLRASTMGRNAKQSRYQSWTDPTHGPHNCGVWFDGNYERIAADTAVPFSRETAALEQRSCNGCHVGCLDCHYDPRPTDPANPGTGVHTFRRVPPPESCYGGGRGPYCHAGPEERRRGAGYFGGPFSHPEGMPADVHVGAKVGCLDCHDTHRTDPKLGHALVKRQARCGKCHEAVVKSHAASLHKSLSCEACHIRNVGGYQATFWGPGILAGSPTPFFKFKDYYGIMRDPILIRDQKGRWIPVKPYPMAVENQKRGLDLAPGLYWRYPASFPDLERTDDAWGYVGIVGGLPENNRAILWIQMDKLSHKYGRARDCGSCHDSPDGEQRQEVRWEFSDEGAFPFKGHHTVVANRQGLSIRGMQADEKVEPSPGYRNSAFAPWLFLPDAWRIPGDFALPPIKDRQRYDAERHDPEKARWSGTIHR